MVVVAIFLLANVFSDSTIINSILSYALITS